MHIKKEMRNFIDKFMALSIKVKVGIILGVIVVASGVGIGTYEIVNANSSETSSPDTVEVLQQKVFPENIVEAEVEVVPEEEVVSEEVPEEVIEIKPREKKEGDVVKYQDKEVTIPKSTVATVNSSEDAEKNKKNGGETVSQEQANEMFQNEGKHSNGIDVSAHQEKIDWAKVKASGVDFAIIRVGFRGQTAGGIYEDKYFKSNVSGAVANGIKVGIYFYSTAINENEALEEAAWVVSKIAPYRITYPVVYDFEDFGAYRCSNVNGEQATKNALTYLNYIKSAGYEPMMYANKNDITKRMSRGSFSCKFWLAHYTTQTDYKGSVNMWQYTSKGSVPGISGPVDMNVAYFSYGTTAAPKHTHNYTEVVKGSEKNATCAEEGTRTLRCSCGDTKTETFPKVEHTWGQWVVDKQPTVAEEGVQKRTCSGCNKEETKKIDKLVDNTTTNNNTISNNTTTNNTNNNNNNNNNVIDNTANSTTNPGANVNTDNNNSSTETGNTNTENSNNGTVTNNEETVNDNIETVGNQ